MSRRKRKEPAGEQAPASAAVGGPELLRRFLLGLLTALIVARPFVLGEDPGILNALTDTSNLVLTLLWLVAVLGWAVWRYWSGNGAWQGGLVEAALLAAVAFVFVGFAAVAPYKHPAALIGWEWLAFLAALFLVRQLAVTESDQRGLLAAFLAGVVSLSVYALYQSAVELPRARTELRDRQEQPAAPPERSGLPMAAGSVGALLREQFRAEEGADQAAAAASAERTEEERSHTFATFRSPDSLAGLLILFLPAVAVAALLRWQACGNSWATWLTAGCALLAAAALWTTHSRSAMLALAVVALMAAVTAGRRWLFSARGLAGSAIVLAGLVLLAVRGGTGALLGRSGDGCILGETWSTTWAMIRDHPWLGVGAGNFGRAYPQYLLVTAAGATNDAHNFVLGLWASYGIFALAAVLLALGAFFVLVLRPGKEVREAVATGPGEPSAETAAPTRWEFYVGGMGGLLLGYFLREAYRSPDEMLHTQALPAIEDVWQRGLVAGVRAVLWFAAFALFEGVPWSAGARRLALAAGVAALLLGLGIAPGIDFPSLAQPLWLAVGLALAARHAAPHLRGGDPWLGRVLPIPLLAGVLLAYFTYVFYPVTRSASLARGALEAAAFFRTQRSLGFRDVRNPGIFLWEKVVKPLDEAAKEDPTDAHRQAQRGFWYGELWTLTVRFPSAEDQKRAKIYSDQAVRWIGEAELLDSQGKEPYLLRYKLHERFAQRIVAVQARRQQYWLASEAMRRLARVDPTDARVRLTLAALLFAAGKHAAGQEAVREALRLDQSAPPPRALGPARRRQAEAWSKAAPVVAGERGQ